MKRAGFTLLEVLLYFALVGTILMLTVTLSLDYTSSQKIRRSSELLVDTVTFVDRKLRWEMGALPQTAILVPSSGQSDSRFRFQQGVGYLEVRLQDNRLVFDRNGSVFPITNSHVAVSNFSATVATRNGQPAVVLSYNLSVSGLPVQTLSNYFYPIPP